LIPCLVCGTRRIIAIKLNENLIVYKAGSTPSLIEGVFVKKLCERVPQTKVLLKHLDDTSLHLENSNTLILIIPTLGDNDLIPELEKELTQFLKLVTPKDNKIFVVFKGDRHLSDEQVSKTSPVYLKTKKLFYKFPQTVFLLSKLDRFTADKIAETLYEYNTNISPRTISNLNQASQITTAPLRFDARKKHLDFYQSETGNSLIKGLDCNDLERLFQLIQALQPEILDISYAYITSEQSQYFSVLSTVRTLLANGNNLTVSNIVQYFPKLNWLNLSANNISSGIEDLNNLTYLQVLQLYKNNLTEFDVGNWIKKIKKMSLYRNQLQELNFPVHDLQIQYLNLGANPLLILPDNLAKANHLEFLGLARTKIRKLPDWLFVLPSLHTIDLSFIEGNIPNSQIDKLLQRNIKIITQPGYKS